MVYGIRYDRYFLLFFPEYRLCNDNSRGTSNKSFILRSQIVHRAFTVHFALRRALLSLIVHRSLALTKFHSACAHPSLRVRSSYAQSALTIQSPFKWESRTFQGLLNIYTVTKLLKSFFYMLKCFNRKYTSLTK